MRVFYGGASAAPRPPAAIHGAKGSGPLEEQGKRGGAWECAAPPPAGPLRHDVIGDAGNQ